MVKQKASSGKKTSRKPKTPSLQNLHPLAIWAFVARFFVLLLVGLGPPLFIGIMLITVIIFEEVTGGEIQFMQGLVVIIFFIILFLLFAIVAAVEWSKLTYKHYHFVITDKGFQKEYGVIWKRYVTIPYDHIQHVSIHRGVIDRYLGLSTIQIFTAGTASMHGGNFTGHHAEGEVPGLLHDTAQQLRDEIIERSNKAIERGL